MVGCGLLSAADGAIGMLAFAGVPWFVGWVVPVAQSSRLLVYEQPESASAAKSARQVEREHRMRNSHPRVILLLLPTNDIGFAGYPRNTRRFMRRKPQSKRLYANVYLKERRPQRQAAFAAPRVAPACHNGALRLGSLRFDGGAKRP